MHYLKTFLNEYLPPLIHTATLTLFSYIVLEIKKIYQKHLDQRIKKEVIETVCHAVNNLYPSLSHEDKLTKIITNAVQILNEKGITMNDLELRMYIEANKIEG